MTYNKIRVGSVPYLNAKPLIYGLNQNPKVDLSFEIPSLLSEQLKDGRIDVALIPTISYFTLKGFSVIPEVCISSDGDVRSVKLFAKVPIERIRRIAVDRSSLSSASLLKILVSEKYRLFPEPEYIICDPQTDLQALESDAALLIGDAAMKWKSDGFFSLDLGGEWKSFAGAPFVYAFWVVRPEVKFEGLSKLLQNAKRGGLKAIGQIAKQASAELALDESICRIYLQENMRYDLGSAQILGLQLFCKFALKLGILSEPNEVRFYEGVK